MRTIVAGLLFVLMLPTAQAEEPPPLKLTVKTDRKRYDLDDTVLVAVDFKNSGAKIQIAPYGNGSAYFHLIIEHLEPTDPKLKGHVSCIPVWELQFVRKQFYEQRPKPVLIEVKSGFTHQLAIHLPLLFKLPEGRYAFRIGYTLRGSKLEPLIKAATGQDVSMDSTGGSVLEGSFDGALLSEPITITIGPDKEKKK